MTTVLVNVLVRQQVAAHPRLRLAIYDQRRAWPDKRRDFSRRRRGFCDLWTYAIMAMNTDDRNPSNVAESVRSATVARIAWTFGDSGLRLGVGPTGLALIYAGGVLRTSKARDAPS